MPNNPLEAKKQELTKENEKLQEFKGKYEDKLAKLKVATDKFRGMRVC